LPCAASRSSPVQICSGAISEHIYERGHACVRCTMTDRRGNAPLFLCVDEIAARITSGTAIFIVDGPDDLCAPLQRKDHACASHCLTQMTRQRDALALAFVGALLGLSLQTSVPFTLSAEHIGLMRQHFRNEPRFRRASMDCEWRGLCDEIVVSGFQRALLFQVKFSS